MKNTAKWLLVALLGLILAVGAVACGEESHTHTAGSGWEKDETNHWHVCTECDEVMDEAAHTPGEWQQDAESGEHYRVCTVCGYETDRAAHTAGDELKFNADYTQQWNECTVCGAKMNEEEHTHSGGTWTAEGDQHYKTCESCSQKYDVAAHISDEVLHFNADYTQQWNECKTCGAKMNEKAHTHSGGTWTAEGDQHYKTCESCSQKYDIAAHISDNELHFNADYTQQWNLCETCDAEMNKTAHNHTADETKWESDGINHWRNCSACGQKIESTQAVHTGEWVYDQTSKKDKKTCPTCNYVAEREHEHTADSEYGHDENGHWFICTGCGAKVQEEAHAFAWADGAGQDAGKYAYVCKCGYVSKSVSKDITPADEALYIELSEESAQLTVTLPEGFAYASLQLDDEDLNVVSLEGGKATVATSAFADAVLGAETALTVFATAEEEQYAFTLRVTVVTKLIKTASDLDAVKYVGTNITGYFLVADDIDASKITISGSKTGEWNQNSGFRGTFDGNGCTISGLTVNTYGIFGQVGGGGVVKNVRFESVYLGANAGLFARFAYNCTFENIYVSYRGFAGNSGNEGGLLVGRQMSNNVKWKNVTLEAYDLDIPSLLGQQVEIRSDVDYPIVFTNVLIRARSYKTIGTDLEKDAEITSLPSGITFEVYAREQTLVEEEVFFENVTDASAAYTLTNDAFAAGTEYTVTVGAQQVHATAEEGKLTFNLGGITLGKNAVVCTSGEQNITFANIWFVTKALSTAGDLEVVRYKGDNSVIEGYYVLKNDILLNGERLVAAAASVWNGEYGFRGIFDGNGKKISNFTVGENGFFGSIGGTGNDITVIKNVTFDQVTMLDEGQSGVLAAAMYCTTVENVTIDLVAVGAGTGTCQGLLVSRYINGAATTTFRNVTVNAQGLAIGGNISLISYQGSPATVYENVVFNVGSYVNVSQNFDGKEEPLTEAPSGVTIKTA